MPSPYHPFAQAAAQAVAKALEMNPQQFIVGAPPKPALGDFAVGCFPAAKPHKTAPAKLAVQVAEQFVANDFLESASAAGPFVNFRARRSPLFSHLLDGAKRDRLSLIPKLEQPQPICIDYSSPNISKHLAYHHIRSTVIGHSLVNLYRALGYHVVGINHLGDWGTTHGMLLAAHQKWGAPDPLTVDALNDLYVRFRREMKQDPTLEQLGRDWFKKLEDGDPQARNLWEQFRSISLGEFQSVYDTLGVSFEEVRGESAYLDAMQPVLDLLAERELSSVSEGALVVSLDDHDMPPLLLRKQDGATLYATRDLAAAIYRWDTYQFARSLYVVDRGQGLHFRQLFTVLAKAGFDWASRCEHVSFGLVRIGGKKTGTRTGNIVLLKEVLKEASERSRERMLERPENTSLDEETLTRTAEQVGVGAVVFANLASQRDKDVDFDWEDVLSTDGDSGPYVQYAHARCCRLLAKAESSTSRESSTGGESPKTTPVDPSLLQHDSEWALALKLLDVGIVVHRCVQTNEPHLLCRYLLDLCALFSRWYTLGNQDAGLRILCEDSATRSARLALVEATREVLRTGLSLLGIQAPAAM